MSDPILEFVPIPQAAKENGYSVASYYRDVKRGTMPAPIPIGPNRKAVPRHELEAAKRAKLKAAGRDVAA